MREKYSWVEEGYLPMDHLLTIDLSPVSSQVRGIPEDAVALSIFLPVAGSGPREYLAEEEGLEPAASTPWFT